MLGPCPSEPTTATHGIQRVLARRATRAATRHKFSLIPLHMGLIIHTSQMGMLRFKV